LHLPLPHNEMLGQNLGGWSRKMLEESRDQQIAVEERWLMGQDNTRH
jgi:hypothetical protein